MLVDADPAECRRLRRRYSDFSNVTVLEKAMGNRDGTTTLMVRSNPAMSGIFSRNPVSPLFTGARLGEEDVVETISVELQTVDSLIRTSGESFDFVKLDTEGNESLILDGWSDLGSLFGVRSEVSFDRLFEEPDQKVNGGTFCRLHSRLLDEGFVLLNLDYRGQGDFYSSMVRPDQPYGVLQSTDAVWIRNPHTIIDHSGGLAVLLKAVIFSVRNSAPDLAIWLLETTSHNLSECPREFEGLKQCARNLMIQHFYSLKWVPGQDIGKHSEWFETIWASTLPLKAEFNESLEHNPLDLT